MNENTNECEGCSYKRDNLCIVLGFGLYAKVAIPISHDDIKCPCCVCLVKMICERRCDEYKLYFRTTDKNARLARKANKGGLKSSLSYNQLISNK